MRLFHLGTLFLFLTGAGGCAHPPAAPTGGEKVEVEVALDAPDTAWSVSIEEIRRVGDEAWVLARLTRAAGMGGMAITQVSDKVRLDPPVPPRRVFVLGKTWNWTGEEGYDYPAATDDLPKAWKDGEVLYRRPKDEDPS